MDDITRLPRCAFAIGSTPKAVSHWLARFPSLAGNDKPASSWNSFRPAAVVKLGCLTVLLRYGFLVDEAVAALAALDPILAPHLTAGPYGSWPAVMATLNDERLTVSRDKHGVYASLSPLPGDDRGDASHLAERLVIDLVPLAGGCAARLASVSEADMTLTPATPPANDTAQPRFKGHA